MFNLDYIIKNKRKIALIFAIIFLFESLSFFSYYCPFFNVATFIILIIACLIASIYNLKFGLYMILTELFFDSMGYIFFAEYGGIKISIRIALWLVVMSIWLAKFLIYLFKEKKELIKRYASIPFFQSFCFLAFFIIIALVYGITKNGFSDAFFDFNAWLYFALIFPFWHVISSSSNEENNLWWTNVVNIFLAGIIFLIFKSLSLLFLFSHNVPVIYDLYSWTRNYSLGEITDMSNGLYRIFFQSQIFIVLAWIFFSIQFIRTTSKKGKIYLFILLSFLSSVLILSFSRSFWVGGILTFILVLSLLLIKFGFKKIIKYFSFTLLLLIAGFLIMFVTIKFPWPNSEAQFGLGSLSDRANISNGESAVSSRWALLGVMKGDLIDNFFLGRGFGARLEYKSSDPRVLERTTDGSYSTYAFEWGWFDIWLKLGLLGVLSYIILLFVILKKVCLDFWRDKNMISLGLGSGIIVLIIVNFFTPYLNHPLGIGFIILSILFLKDKVCSKY
jgi:hypothetical protein